MRTITDGSILPAGLDPSYGAPGTDPSIVLHLEQVEPPETPKGLRRPIGPASPPRPGLDICVRTARYPFPLESMLP